MHRLLTATAAVLTLSSPLAAADHPAVVELFTSQGCNSCPPADMLLGELAERDDVIALALHVDYWDYLGWKDEFADPAHTDRQRGYARAANSRTIYTPQMIIGGVDHVVGYRPNEVAELLKAHIAKPAAMHLEVTREGSVLKISCEGEGEGSGDMVVHLVTYEPSRTVDIRRGENAGKRLTYYNVVTGWTRAALWDGRAPLEIETPAPDAAHAVVLVQKVGVGAILAAVEVN